MIDGLKPYCEMKDSGIEWLGEAPGHWAVERAKWLFQRMERPVQEEDEVVTCFRDGVVTLRKNRRESGFTESLKEIGYQGIRAGDLVIHSMDAFAGAIGISDCDGKGTPVYSVCKPSPQVNAYFFAYILREMARKGWIQALAKGIRERSSDFRYTDFALQLVPLPPFSEQATIVRFLDHADRRIRRYIRAKQKLIALLEEQKQAIIHQAVTGQIDVRTGQAYPAYKPSGVEWLGEVPEHWEVVALRYVATKFGSGVTPRGGATMYEVTGIPFLRSQNIHFDGIHLEGVVRIPQDLHDTLAGTHVKPGDVLLNITGASIGRVCSVPDNFEEGNVNQHVCIIRPKRGRVLPGFLAAFLSTPFMQREIRFEQNGASREGLTLHSIRGFKVALPTAAEQQHILDEIRGQTGQLAVATATAQGEVDLLREYRIRLIADVVTGKLDVREAAAGLPKVDPLEGDGDLDETPDIGGPEAEVSELALGKEEAEA